MLRTMCGVGGVRKSVIPADRRRIAIRHGQGAPTSITRDFAELLLVTLAHELKRRGSEPFETATVLPETRDRLDVVAPELALGRRPRWQATFRSWLDYVEARPRST